MEPEQKKRKFKPPPHKSKTAASSAGPKTAADEAATIRSGSGVGISSSSSSSSSSRVDPWIEQGKTMAVSQAQKDGCTGNYRIMDSPFGNFLLPVLPTRAELLSG
ncbi:unnamed protein product [Linum tenue]|uniref:Uncharacterized protein n=1 Tax=Linum tenue TaxID=586396 RepID=A0AAV0QFF4_9ROSI|nr:unnamed protein product [Linum tenue]